MRFDVDYGMKSGDSLTIAGVWRKIPNPDRKWWQFWRPRMVASGEYQRFTVTEIS